MTNYKPLITNIFSPYVYMGGGVCNMYTGTLVDVINEATIKAPDRPVAGVHHLININAANKGTAYQRTTAGRLNWIPAREKEAYKAMYKGRLHQKGKLPGIEAHGFNDPFVRDFVRRVSAGSGVNYGVK